LAQEIEPFQCNVLAVECSFGNWLLSSVHLATGPALLSLLNNKLNSTQLAINIFGKKVQSPLKRFPSIIIILLMVFLD
jgi:hypothetical protein